MRVFSWDFNVDELWSYLKGRNHGLLSTRGGRVTFGTCFGSTFPQGEDY